MRTLALLACCGMLAAAMQEHPLVSEFDGATYAGTLVYDDAHGDRQPALLMVPNWMGPTPGSLTKAKLIAAMGYVVYMADVYGADVRPTNAGEAREAATLLRSDRPLLRARAQQQLALLKAQAGSHPIDPERVGAIGFCFGGGTVLELARDGAELIGVVSFHGNLDTPDPALAKQIRCPLLVCHGAEDPAVPMEQVTAFFAEMAAADVDYQFIAYGGAVHSFTNPEADTPGRSQYHEQAAKRSFAAMNAFFAEAIAD